jgi:hypothetical protein
LAGAAEGRGKLACTQTARPPLPAPDDSVPPFCWCREFVEQMLPHFRQDNPQIAIETVVQRAKHPGLQAEYRKWWC